MSLIPGPNLGQILQARMNFGVVGAAPRDVMKLYPTIYGWLERNDYILDTPKKILSTADPAVFWTDPAITIFKFENYT